MSQLLQTAVHAGAATPLPTPEVIKQTIKQVVQVPVTPPAVIQLFQMLGLAVAGVATSILHWLAQREKWSDNVNRLVWAGYSLVGGLVFAYLTGNFGTSAEQLVAQFVGVTGMAGSSAAFFNLVKFLNQVVTNAQAIPEASASATAD